MTARLIRSHELLDAARLLAPPAVGPGRPRTAHLRRAVSTAYYALFHELVAQSAAELCGASAGDDTRRRHASRWIAHSDLRTLAQAATRAVAGRVAPVASVLGPPHQDLAYVADVFVQLQEARHQADYDHEYDVSRSEALSLIDDAEDAIDRVRKLERSGEPSYRRFLKLMVGAVKVARTRVL